MHSKLNIKYLLWGLALVAVLLAALWALQWLGGISKSGMEIATESNANMEKVQQFRYEYNDICNKPGVTHGCIVDLRATQMDDASDLLEQCLTDFTTKIALLNNPTNVNFFVLLVSSAEEISPFEYNFRFNCMPYETRAEYDTLFGVHQEKIDQLLQTAGYNGLINRDCSLRDQKNVSMSKRLLIEKARQKCLNAKKAFIAAIDNVPSDETSNSADGPQESFRKKTERQRAAANNEWKKYRTMMSSEAVRKKFLTTTAASLGGALPDNGQCLVASLERAVTLARKHAPNDRLSMTIISDFADTCDADPHVLAEALKNAELYINQVIVNPDKDNKSQKTLRELSDLAVRHTRVPRWQLPELSPPPAKPSSCQGNSHTVCLIDFSASHNKIKPGLLNACVEEAGKMALDPRYDSLDLSVLPIGSFSQINTETAPVIASWRENCVNAPSNLLNQYRELTARHEQIKTALVAKTPLNQQRKSEIYKQITDYNADVIGFAQALFWHEAMRQATQKKILSSLAEFTRSDRAVQLVDEVQDQFKGIEKDTCMKTAFWQAGRLFDKVSYREKENSTLPTRKVLLVFSDLQEDCPGADNSLPLELIFSSLRGAEMHLYGFSAKHKKRPPTLETAWQESLTALGVSIDTKFIALPIQQ